MVPSHRIASLSRFDGWAFRRPLLPPSQHPLGGVTKQVAILFSLNPSPICLPLFCLVPILCRASPNGPYHFFIHPAPRLPRSTGAPYDRRLVFRPPVSLFLAIFSSFYHLPTLRRFSFPLQLPKLVPSNSVFSRTGNPHKIAFLSKSW